MERLNDILNKYNTVIFDMDGVITSEQNYWNSAALTVWEYLKCARLVRDIKIKNRDIKILSGDIKYTPSELEANVESIRSEVFSKDRLIGILKEKGVNSNWDLGYVTLALAVINDCEDFSMLPEYAEKLGGNILEEYDAIAKALSDRFGGGDFSRSSNLWREMQLCFQEWFLGDELYLKTCGKPKVCGKRGLLHSERPIVSIDKLRTLMRLMYEAGKRICTGTGRPAEEILSPLEDWDIKKYFAPDGLINYSHVTEAEKALGAGALTKPHPYMFLKALFGEGMSDNDIVSGNYDSSAAKRALIVGDAGSDILAAKAMGADFCAVLTGIKGPAGRSYFENLGAEYILSSVEELVIC